MAPSLARFGMSVVSCAAHTNADAISQVQSAGESSLPSLAGCMLTDAANMQLAFAARLCCFFHVSSGTIFLVMMAHFLRLAMTTVPTISLVWGSLKKKKNYKW